MTPVLSRLTPGVLSASAYPGATGRGVRVAVVDSGVQPTHPHIGLVETGVSFDAAGVRSTDTLDRFGHGTAVAAAIHEKAPDAVLIPVKVFDRTLRATADALVAAIDWAVASGVHLINLSLGTANPAHRLKLGEALVRAARGNVALVAAGEQDGITWLPGSLPLAVGVTVDWSAPRQHAEVTVTQEGAVRRIRVRASGYPRPMAGAPADEPVKGVSFAVANVTGLLCLHLSHERQR